MVLANRSSHEILIRRAEISCASEDMDRDIAPLSRNVLASFLANRAGVPVETPDTSERTLQVG
jgi:hypothetical protein